MKPSVSIEKIKNVNIYRKWWIKIILSKRFLSLILPFLFFVLICSIFAISYKLFLNNLNKEVFILFYQIIGFYSCLLQLYITISIIAFQIMDFKKELRSSITWKKWTFKTQEFFIYWTILAVNFTITTFLISLYHLYSNDGFLHIHFILVIFTSLNIMIEDNQNSIDNLVNLVFIDLNDQNHKNQKFYYLEWIGLINIFGLFNIISLKS